MDNEAVLLDIIDRTLETKPTLAAFYQAFYGYWIDYVDDASIGEEKAPSFDEVTEKLDFTAESPTEDERSYGYVSWPELLTWLSNWREQYRTRFEN